MILLKKCTIIFAEEHSKDAWYYDEQDMLDMDAYDEPDAESDYDYEESYSSKRKRRKPRGGGHHPVRSHPSSTDSPGSKRTKVNFVTQYQRRIKRKLLRCILLLMANSLVLFYLDMK